MGFLLNSMDFQMKSMDFLVKSMDSLVKSMDSLLKSMDFLVKSIDFIARFNGLTFEVYNFVRQNRWNIWGKKPRQNLQGSQDIQRIRDLQGNVRTLEQ